MLYEVRLILVGALLARAIYTDVKEGKIENMVIAVGLLWGILYAYMTGGWGEILRAGKCAVLVFVSLYGFFLLRGLGAGDIKLMMVLVLFYPDRAFMMVAEAFVAGAGMALCRMGKRFVTGQVVYKKGETIPFSIPVTCSVLLCAIQEVIG